MNDNYLIFCHKKDTPTMMFAISSFVDFRSIVVCKKKNYLCYAIDKFENVKSINCLKKYEKYLAIIKNHDSNQEINV